MLAVERLSLAGIERRISVTVGLAATASGQCTPAVLLDRADQVLLEAKKAGKGRVEVFGDMARAGSDTGTDLLTAEDVRRLEGWLESDNVEVRRDAAHELLSLATTRMLFHIEAMRPLPRRLLKDQDPQIRVLGLQAIAAIAAKEGEQATGYYGRALVELRARAIATVGHSGDLRFLEQICDWVANWEQATYTRVNPIAGLIGLAKQHRVQVTECLRRRAETATTDQQGARFGEALQEIRSIR